MARRATLRGERTQVTKFAIEGLSRGQGLGAAPCQRLRADFVFSTVIPARLWGAAEGSILVRLGGVDGVFSGAQLAFSGARQGIFGVSIFLIETSSTGRFQA